jgi:hypothetical protein
MPPFLTIPVNPTTCFCERRKLGRSGTGLWQPRRFSAEMVSAGDGTNVGWGPRMRQQWAERGPGQAG